MIKVLGLDKKPLKSSFCGKTEKDVARSVGGSAVERHRRDSNITPGRFQTGRAKMLEGTTNRERIIAAALRLAETRGWRDLSLGEIAAEAGVPLAEFRKEFQSKGQILAAFSRAVDLAVIEKFPAPGPDVARDRLFDVLLTRFEVMQPYKAAIRRIREDVGSSLGESLAQMRPALKSQYWMLAAAGISGEGGTGLVRVRGLLSIYSRVFSIWLEEDDPGMARTMAALDRRLRRGESVMRGIERFRDGLESLTRSLRGARKRVKDEPQSDVPPPEPDAPSAAQQPI